jgi:hypothetical protein
MLRAVERAERTFEIQAGKSVDGAETELDYAPLYGLCLMKK